MKYRCVKEFGLPKVNDGGIETGDYYFIEVDSTWELNENKHYLSTGCHLERVENVADVIPEWIEISKDTLGQYFEEV